MPLCRRFLTFFTKSQGSKGQVTKPGQPYQGRCSSRAGVCVGVFGLEWIVWDGGSRSEKGSQEYSIKRMYESTGELA